MNPKLLITRAVCLVAVTVSSFACMVAAGRSKTPTTEFTARSVAQPGLPLTIDSVFATSNPVISENILAFNVTNHSSSTLKRLATFVLWLDPNKTVRGGQTNYQVVDIGTEAKQQLTVKLNLVGLNPSDGEGELVLIVREARTDASVWKQTMTQKELVAAMKNGQPVPVAAGEAGATSLQLTGLSASASSGDCELALKGAPQGG